MNFGANDLDGTVDDTKKFILWQRRGSIAKINNPGMGLSDNIGWKNTY